jgi:hypothetical protein
MKIADVIKSGGKCSFEEYNVILSEIKKKKNNTNLLVFGTGHDTPLWKSANKGITMFVENNPRWIKEKDGVIQVVYASKNMSKTVIHPVSKLHMNLGEAEKVDWNIIFVDSPVGRTQGRMKSIYNAWRLANAEGKKRKCVVFVHDYNRVTEKLYVDHFFKNVSVVGTLAICS